jgi:hypothetical protein
MLAKTDFISLKLGGLTFRTFFVGLGTIVNKVIIARIDRQALR